MAAVEGRLIILSPRPLAGTLMHMSSHGRLAMRVRRFQGLIRNSAI
jgi:hypothetical protein